MPHQIYSGCPESVPQYLDEVTGVRDELLDCEGLCRERREIGFPSPSLIPMDDQKLFLQGAVRLKEGHEWETWASMQEQEKRMCCIVTTNQNPLSHPTDRDFL